VIEQDRPRLDADDLEQSGWAPRIGGQARTDSVLARRIDDEKHLRSLTERAAEEDEALGRKRVHERRVLGPQHLRAHRHRGIPCRPSSSTYGKVRGHQGKSCATCTLDPAAASGATLAAGLATPLRA
jgi:hypothetical protein